MIVTPAQLRAARALLRMEQRELARRLRLPVMMIRRLEGPDGGELVAPATLDAVRQALEHAGVEFIPDGVRRCPPSRPDAEALFEKLRAISLRSAARLEGREPIEEADLYDEHGLPVCS
jgi:transcriptional regulator with XRE-family HTH domain